jgi:hypothetical protein
MADDDNQSTSSSLSRRKSVLPSSGDSIKVVCRFRPPKKNEIEMYGQSATFDCFKIDEIRNTVEATVDYEKKSFTFDKVILLPSC